MKFPLSAFRFSLSAFVFGLAFGASAQFATNAPGVISPTNYFGTNAIRFATNSPAFATNTPGSVAPTNYFGTNAIKFATNAPAFATNRAGSLAATNYFSTNLIRSATNSSAFGTNSPGSLTSAGTFTGSASYVDPNAPVPGFKIFNNGNAGYWAGYSSVLLLQLTNVNCSTWGKTNAALMLYGTNGTDGVIVFGTLPMPAGFTNASVSVTNSSWTGSYGNWTGGTAFFARYYAGGIYGNPSATNVATGAGWTPPASP